jgi:hypothetical protein
MLSSFNHRMSLLSELVNLSAILLPTLLALLCQLMPTRTIGRKVFTVVMISLCSVLVIGFGLMGLTRSCFSDAPLCEAGTEAKEIFGNMLGDQHSCLACISSDRSGEIGLSYTLNQFRPPVLIVSVALCLGISAWSLVSFAMWMRRADPMMRSRGKRE